MRVFIAGASGVLGRRLVRQFTTRGHSVIGLARSPKAEISVKDAGGEPRNADLFDADSLARAAEGCDTVIHAATAIPTKRNPSPADWALNDRIRRKGTRCLTEAAAKIGAKTFLQQSVAWVARPADDRLLGRTLPAYPMPRFYRPSMRKTSRGRRDRRKDLRFRFCEAAIFTIPNRRTRG